MPQLAENADVKTTTGLAAARRFVRDRRRRASKAILKSHRMHPIRGRDFPIRIRPWFLVFTVVTMLLLALLGFTNVGRNLPVNDKILHFFCLGTATGLFYWCFEPEEDVRRIWFWRNVGLIGTIALCFFFGGVVSEFVQSLLPYKTFDGGDILANLLGSSFGLAVSWNLERYYRRRREIARLYTPLDVSSDDSLDEDEPSELPVYRQATGSTFGRAPSALTTPNANTSNAGPPRTKSSRLTNVWDSRDGEELFAVGEEDEDEDDDLAKLKSAPRASSPSPQR